MRPVPAFCITSTLLTSTLLSAHLLSPAPTFATPVVTADQGATSVSLATATLPGRQVWGHMVPHGLADYREGVPQYGADYPLDLIPGGYWDAPRPTAGVVRAQQAGLTGMQLLQFDWENKGSDFVDEWMVKADPTWRDQDPMNNFSIAPCWLLTKPGSAVRLAREYAQAAAGHPSAARIGGKLVIYVYAPRNLTPAQWAAERTALKEARLDVFLIADLQTDSSQHGYALNSGMIDPWAAHFDAVWLFEDSTNRIWQDLTKLLATRRYPFAGGIMPGYNRETSESGGFVTPDGTKQFRQQWEGHLASQVSWVNIVTWNDTVERTNIKANSDWNVTRQDINAFYAAKFRTIPFPKPSAQLYVTTPDFIRSGGSPRAEGMVLNGGTTPVIVHTRLVDKDKRPLTKTYSTTVAPGTSGDATVPDVLTSYPNGRFVRAETWTTDVSGRVLQQVTSAPILMYDAQTQTTPMMRTHFYSIPASRALNVRPTLTANGTNLGAQGTTVTAAVPTGTRKAPIHVKPRFIEVLQNTRQAKIAFDSMSVRTTPMQPRLIVGGQTIAAAPNGFYVARLIDDQERVAYSDPITIG